jgi:hypothetical protein
LDFGDRFARLVAGEALPGEGLRLDDDGVVAEGREVEQDWQNQSSSPSSSCGEIETHDGWNAYEPKDCAMISGFK